MASTVQVIHAPSVTSPSARLDTHPDCAHSKLASSRTEKWTRKSAYELRAPVLIHWANLGRDADAVASIAWRRLAMPSQIATASAKAMRSRKSQANAATPTPARDHNSLPTDRKSTRLNSSHSQISYS